MRLRIVAAVGIALLLASIVGAAQARGRGLAQSNNCSIVGTAFGESDSGFTWIGTATPGMNATEGQLELDWVLIDPTLDGFFPTAVRATPGKGVWEMVNRNKYKYTWVAYGLSAAGQPVFVVRTSGFLTMAGCDQFNIMYTMELFAPGQDIWSDSPAFGAFQGSGAEKRMPLVVVQ